MQYLTDLKISCISKIMSQHKCSFRILHSNKIPLEIRSIEIQINLNDPNFYTKHGVAINVQFRNHFV